MTQEHWLSAYPPTKSSKTENSQKLKLYYIPNFPKKKKTNNKKYLYKPQEINFALFERGTQLGYVSKNEIIALVDFINTHIKALTSCHFWPTKFQYLYLTNGPDLQLFWGRIRCVADIKKRPSNMSNPTPSSKSPHWLGFADKFLSHQSFPRAHIRIWNLKPWVNATRIILNH